MEIEARYWIVVVSKDHLERGVAGSFMQVNHGKEAPLKRLQKGDWVVFAQKGVWRQGAIAGIYGYR